MHTKAVGRKRKKPQEKKKKPLSHILRLWSKDPATEFGDPSEGEKKGSLVNRG